MQEVPDHVVDLAVPSVLIVLVLFAMPVLRIAALLDRLVASVQLVLMTWWAMAHQQQQQQRQQQQPVLTMVLRALAQMYQVAQVKIAKIPVSLVMVLQVCWGV